MTKEQEKQISDLKNNTIPTQKIIDKIEEYKKNWVIGDINVLNTLKNYWRKNNGRK